MREWIPRLARLQTSNCGKRTSAPLNILPPLVGNCYHKCSKPSEPLTGLTFTHISIGKSECKIQSLIVIKKISNRKSLVPLIKYNIFRIKPLMQSACKVCLARLCVCFEQQWLQIRAHQGNKGTGRQTIFLRIHSIHWINKIIVPTSSSFARDM